jgi:hypothetical protein
MKEIKMNYYFEDFTENNYRDLLRLCKENYRFILYDDYKKSDEKVVLWRHDIDLSVHRARKLAQIEKEENVIATYFIHLHSEFYNALEKDVAENIIKIIELGHTIGLHFDINFYYSQCSLPRNIINSMEYYLKLEKDLLEKMFHQKITVFSFHNPELSNLLQVNKEYINDMVNVYSPYFKENYTYCSDSNGYWRFRRLEDILQEASAKKLQILTHPGLWVPSVMAPRERITRCIDGRAAKTNVYWDNLMKVSGRENVKNK